MTSLTRLAEALRAAGAGISLPPPLAPTDLANGVALPAMQVRVAEYAAPAAHGR